MPDKRFGMFDMLKGVFRAKKPLSEDIVYQAERIISDYVSHKRGQIHLKCYKRKHTLKNLMLVCLFGALLFVAYRIVA